MSLNNAPNPKHNLITEIRILQRILAETVKGIFHTGVKNFVIIGTMAAILSIFGCMFRITLSLSDFVQDLGKVLEISVYLEDNVRPKDMAKKIIKMNNISKVKIIPKEKAWDDMQNQMVVPDIDNPLPNTLRVKVASQEYLNDVAENLRGMDGVEDISYAQELAYKMQNISHLAGVGTAALLIFMGFLTLFIINNTIILVIQSRKKEIEIMRLMGVTDWYIKAPYILQGGFYGLSGALVALGPLAVVQGYISNINQFFNLSPAPYNENLVVFSLLMMGIMVGTLGSWFTVRRYIRV